MNEPRLTTPHRLALSIAFLASMLQPAVVRAADPWVVLDGGEGPGKGKKIVFVTGDEEYRSEEAMPQLAKILAKKHGFTCTVLFAIGKDGTIDPNRNDHIAGLEALKDADLMVLFTRWRNLPDDEMKAFADYLDSGRPLIGLRTATHPFNLDAKREYARFSYNSKKPDWDGGFGRQVFGETWISHHGKHGSQGTRGVVAPGAESDPIVKGIRDGDIFGPTDVYGVRLPLPGDSKPLILGQVLEGMKPGDPPIVGKVNAPMMPIAWTRTYSAAGKPARVFTTTMGASQDLLSDGLRRLLVNACYWAVGIEEKIAADSDVGIVGDYKPTGFGFGKFKKGVKPEDLAGK